MRSYNGIIKFICLLFIAPVVVWKFGIGETYTLYKEKQKLLDLNKKIPAISSISVANTTIFTTEPLLSNGRFLQLFTDSLASKQIEIVSYTPEMIDSEGEAKLYCGKLMLAGGYIELVQMVSVIEKATLPLKIASMSFEYDTKKRDVSKKIYLSLLVEQIEH